MPNCRSKYYVLTAAAGSDLHYSAMTVTLKCLAGETLLLSSEMLKVRNGKVSIYFNGVPKFRSTYTRLNTRSCRGLYDTCLHMYM